MLNSHRTATHPPTVVFEDTHMRARTHTHSLTHTHARTHTHTHTRVAILPDANTALVFEGMKNTQAPLLYEEKEREDRDQLERAGTFSEKLHSPHYARRSSARTLNQNTRLMERKGSRTLLDCNFSRRLGESGSLCTKGEL